jgi:hypothetical protein
LQPSVTLEPLGKCNRILEVFFDSTRDIRSRVPLELLHEPIAAECVNRERQHLRDLVAPFAHERGSEANDLRSRDGRHLIALTRREPEFASDTLRIAQEPRTHTRIRVDPREQSLAIR